jgi:hypothetical protein
MNRRESLGIDNSIGYVEQNTADRSNRGRGSQREERRVNDAARIGRRRAASSSAIDTVGKLESAKREVGCESVWHDRKSSRIEDCRVNSHLDVPGVERVHLKDFDGEEDVGSDSLSTIDVTRADVEDIRICRFGRRSRKRAC